MSNSKSFWTAWTAPSDYIQRQKIVFWSDVVFLTTYRHIRGSCHEKRVQWYTFHGPYTKTSNKDWRCLRSRMDSSNSSGVSISSGVMRSSTPGDNMSVSLWLLSDDMLFWSSSLLLRMSGATCILRLVGCIRGSSEEGRSENKAWEIIKKLNEQKC